MRRRWGALLVVAGVLSSSGWARANAAARSYIEGSGSSGYLSASNGAGIHVVAVRVDLDFRAHDRGASKSRYLLENRTDAAWEDDVVFIATADDVHVSVDGAPVAGHAGDLALAKDVGRHEDGARGPSSLTIFHLVIAPHARCEVTVTFVAKPGHAFERTEEERQADGLTRVAHDLHAYQPSGDRFEYPLWPAAGFGDGVGPMEVAVRVDEGATFGWTDPPPIVTELGNHEKSYTFRTAAAETERDLKTRAVSVDYRNPGDPAPIVGATVFGAMRFESKKGHAFGGNARVTGDVVFYDRFGVSAGAETDFNRTVSAVATMQTGSAGSYASGYLGGGGIVTIKPGTAVGIEGAAGVRLLIVPLDLAVQVYPYRDKRATDEIGAFRVLLGVKLAL